MRAGTRLAIVATLLLHLTPQPNGAANLNLTSAQWQQDVEYFGKELPRRHKNAFHAVPQAEFESAVQRLVQDVPKLQPHEIIVRMIMLAAMVGDSHTSVHLPEEFKALPLSLVWFGSELRVTAAPPAYQRALGTRVTHVNGIPIDEVQQRLRAVLSRGQNQWFTLAQSPAYLGRPEVLHTLGITPGPDRATFSFVADDGSAFELEIAGVPSEPRPQTQSAAASVPLFRQRPGESFWFTRVSDSPIVYAAFRNYKDISGPARDLWASLNDAPAECLVIDLRLNGGGDFNVGRRHVVEPLKKALASGKVRRAYAVTGRRTFSAALANSIDLKRAGAYVVGEPPGEAPNSYSENDEMTLPNSKLVISYSTRYYRFLEEDVPAFLPDHLIPPTWADFARGRDPVMEFIQKQCGAGQGSR